MPSLASGPPRRKHVTTACVSCRESKIKCDGSSPACSNCQNKGKECRYQAGDDKRKLSYRVAIELLSSRIQQLVTFINENSLQPPRMPEDDHISLMDVLDRLKLSHVYAFENASASLSSNSNTLPSYTASHQHPTTAVSSLAQDNQDESQAVQLPTNQDATTVWDELNASMAPTSDHATIYPSSIAINPRYLHANEQSPAEEQATTKTASVNWAWSNPEDPGFSFQPAIFLTDDTDAIGDILDFPSTDSPPTRKVIRLPTAPLHPDEGASDTESTEALVDQLSERIGSLQIGPGGQVRYYGPTSNFNLVEMPAPDNLTVHRTVRNDGQEYLDRLGMGKEVPRQLEEHLVNLYFAWQDPAFHVVNRSMFERARLSWRENHEDTPYYSEALQNAICCLGAAFEARHHPTFVTFPKSLSDFFADRAKALLEIELDNPSVATVQAMVVLSNHDIGCKRDARGWLYSGMAMRLAFDLALHVDLTRYVSKGSLSQAEADLRRDVFWGAYTVDHMWSFYLGRPFRINMEDVTVAKPDGQTPPGFVEEWIPYISPKSLAECKPLPDYTNELHRQRVLLCEIMAPLGYALYGSLKIPSKSLQEMNVVTVEALLNWQANLPSVLQVDLDDSETQYLPHVILLHMQYHQNIIHAHRPWMSRTYTQPSPPQGPGSTHARMMCIDSAHAIAKLLQIYETRYALRRMNIQGVGIACSAALLLTFANVTNYHGACADAAADADDVGLHLGACFRALDEFSAAWESSKRAKDFLILLQRQWGELGAGRRQRQQQGANTRGRRSSGSDDTQLPRKRTRPSVDEGQGRGPDLRDTTSSSMSSSLNRPQPGLAAATGPVDLDVGIDFDWILAGDQCPPPLTPREDL